MYPIHDELCDYLEESRGIHCQSQAKQIIEEAMCYCKTAVSLGHIANATNFAPGFHPF